MSDAPVYQGENGWYYAMFGSSHGPYLTKEMAEDAYETHLNLLSGCRTGTCED